MKTFLIATLARFKEPSSFAGISLILTNLGIQLPNGTAEGISYVLAGIAGILAVVLAEKK
jgi:hypothetical protein